MLGRRLLSVLSAGVLATAAARPVGVAAQIAQDQAVSHQQGEEPPSYRPPPRGAPGGRVGGASRGTFRLAAPLPEIELLAPGDHTGLTANPAPSLYFFTSGPVPWPTRFTISAPGRPNPVLEVPIAAPAAAGIYRVDLAHYRVRLEPGVIYTWSVSAVLDPPMHARDIVASATIMLSPGNWGAVAGAQPPVRRAALWARDGVWYDAVTAAVAAENLDRHAGLDALLREVGLAQPAAFDRQPGLRAR